jgi:hypothetical protein
MHSGYACGTHYCVCEHIVFCQQLLQGCSTAWRFMYAYLAVLLLELLQRGLRLSCRLAQLLQLLG